MDTLTTTRSGSLGTPAATQTTILAPEADPSAVIDGTSCAGFSHVAASCGTLNAAPTYTLRAWVHDGVQWVRACAADGTPHEAAGLTGTFGYIFDVAGFSRFALQVSAFAGGGAASLVRVVRPIGPGV